MAAVGHVIVVTINYRLGPLGQYGRHVQFDAPRIVYGFVTLSLWLFLRKLFIDLL